MPTAFYRHFDSVDSLGLALVDESFGRCGDAARRLPPVPAFERHTSTTRCQVLADHVHAHRDHYAFIARERAAGPLVVREAIRHEIELIDPRARHGRRPVPGSDAFSTEDLKVLADLIVVLVVTTAERMLEDAGAEAEHAMVERARVQLRMLMVGALNWQSRGVDAVPRSAHGTRDRPGLPPPHRQRAPSRRSGGFASHPPRRVAFR